MYIYIYIYIYIHQEIRGSTCNIFKGTFSQYLMRKSSLKIPHFSEILVKKLGKAVQLPDKKRAYIRSCRMCIYIFIYTYMKMLSFLVLCR